MGVNDDDRDPVEMGIEGFVKGWKSVKSVEHAGEEFVKVLIPLMHFLIYISTVTVYVFIRRNLGPGFLSWVGNFFSMFYIFLIPYSVVPLLSFCSIIPTVSWSFQEIPSESEILLMTFFLMSVFQTVFTRMQKDKGIDQEHSEFVGYPFWGCIDVTKVHPALIAIVIEPLLCCGAGFVFVQFWSVIGSWLIFSSACMAAYNIKLFSDIEKQLQAQQDAQIHAQNMKYYQQHWMQPAAGQKQPHPATVNVPGIVKRNKPRGPSGKKRII